jgi:hypothetical protein
MSQEHRSLPESPLDPRVLGVVGVYAVFAAVGTLAAAATRGLVAVVPLFLTAIMVLAAAVLRAAERFR